MGEGAGVIESSGLLAPSSSDRAVSSQTLSSGVGVPCQGSSKSTLPITLGFDGVSIVVQTNGAAHRCIAAIGGLTIAQARWMFSSFDDAQLSADSAFNLATVAPNDDGDGVRE